MAASESGLLVIERILRDREGIWRQIADERDLSRLTVQMLSSTAIALALFGAVLGSFNSVWMAMTSAVKLPLLFLATLAICLPALYLFNLVFGARLSVRQALALVMTAMTVISMLSLAFAPISLFFRITSPDYEFFKILNVAILTLTALVGLKFLTSGMRALNERESAPALVVAAEQPVEQRELVPAGAPAVAAPVDGNGQGASIPAQPVYPGWPSPAPAAASREKSGSMSLLYVWILLFGFVGTQLAWTLRPFFGAPSEPFAFFRNLEGNFYMSVLNDLGNLF